MLQALARERGDRGGAQGDPARARRRGLAGRPAQAGAAAGRARPRPSARPCSRSPASTPTATCCWPIPSSRELRIRAAGRASGRAGAGRRRPGAGAAAAGRRGRVRGAAASGSCRASRARSPASSSAAATGCASARPTARRGPSSLVAPSDLAGAAAGRSGGGRDRARAGGSGSARAKVKERVGRPDDPAALTPDDRGGAGPADGLPAGGAGTGRRGAAGGAGQARGPARGAAGHHRRRGRARLRRRGLGRARSRPGQSGGHRLLVAIADVAHYVRPNDALDREARQRGNSVYFPDRVHADAAGGAVQRPVLAAARTRTAPASRSGSTHRPHGRRSAPGASAAG